MALLSRAIFGEPPLAEVVFSGKVASGRGRAKSELLPWIEQLQALTGEKLHPGSLNLYLDRPLRLNEAAAFKFDGGRRMVWRASLNGSSVLLYRWRECPFHVVEVLSSTALRECLRLKDGDNITLKVGYTQVGLIKPIEHFIWAALWAGRGKWHYSSTKYCGFCILLGVAQQEPVNAGILTGSFAVIRNITRRTPVFGSFVRRARRAISPKRYKLSRG